MPSGPNQPYLSAILETPRAILVGLTAQALQFLIVLCFPSSRAYESPGLRHNVQQIVTDRIHHPLGVSKRAKHPRRCTEMFCLKWCCMNAGPRALVRTLFQIDPYNTPNAASNAA